MTQLIDAAGGGPTQRPGCAVESGMRLGVGQERYQKQKSSVDDAAETTILANQMMGSRKKKQQNETGIAGIAGIAG